MKDLEEDCRKNSFIRVVFYIPTTNEVANESDCPVKGHYDPKLGLYVPERCNIAKDDPIEDRQ
jgi:hypothetical protein